MLAGWSALQREDEEPHLCGGAAVPIAALQPHPARHKAGGKQWHHLRGSYALELALCVAVLCAPCYGLVQTINALAQIFMRILLSFWRTAL